MVKTIKHALSKTKINKDVTLDTHIAHFLATYWNTQRTPTSRTPAEVLLNRAPQTRLPLVHPCTSQRLEETAEMQVGNKQPRSFVGNDHVMVRDLHPNATKKWRKGTVIKVMGPLNYKVTIDGHSHQAHVDHLLPSTSNSAADNPVCSEEQSVQEQVNLDEVVSTQPNTIVPLVPFEVECNSHNDSPEQEMVTLRPARNRHPPTRLIEEMN